MQSLTPSIARVNDMLTKNIAQFFALCILLAFFGASAGAQEQVYKWVDEEGVVHFSDTPPDDSESVETETLTTPKAPPYVPAAQSAVKVSGASDTGAESQSAQPEVQTSPVVEEIDITEMTIADLNQRCEDAREEMIAPLREAEIQNCVQEERKEPEYCERYWADYGAPNFVHNERGTFLTSRRVGYDLPECVAAEEEWYRRKQ